ncbi:RHS repeat-associated core domain-containing protein [Solilutibacter silvestris]|uniref:RHS repeat-associated core domain-containing protein n=1 Tax=Solilutibacter silvestris TaxID=1645665 RepID=UPI003D32DB03
MKKLLWERVARLCLIVGVMVLAGASLDVKPQTSPTGDVMINTTSRGQNWTLSEHPAHVGSPAKSSAQRMPMLANTSTSATSTAYYGAPYTSWNNPTLSADIQAWRTWWLSQWPSYAFCTYNLTLYDPQAYSGLVATETMNPPCGGTQPFYATAYSYAPGKVLGKPCNCVGDPINFGTGNEYRDDTDFDIGVLALHRYYNSNTSVAPGHFGAHWRHTFDRSIEYFSSGSSARVTAYRPDGRQVAFTLQTGVWKADADVSDALIATYDASNNLTGFIFTDATTRHQENYDSQGHLLGIVDTNNQITVFTYSNASTPASIAPSSGLLLTVQDPRGRQLAFTYNAQGNVATVTLPDSGAINYAYDSNGNLVKVTYPDTKYRQYVYNEATLTSNTNLPNALTGEIDESSVRLTDIGYDSQGRAILSRSAGGVDLTQVSYGSGGSNTVTYPAGVQVTYGFLTPNGTVRASSASGPCGPNCGQGYSSLTFDANGYPATSIDFNNTTTATTYSSAGLLTEKIEAQGKSTQRTTNTTWNTALRVPLSRTVLDNANAIVASTSWAYNSAGQTTARCEIDPSLSAATSYTCGSSANAPTGVRQWTYTYCTSVNGTQCPLVGLLLSVKGPRTDANSATTYSYYLSDDPTCASTPQGACAHRKGDLWTTTNALGQVTETLAYDGAGRVLSVKDPNGIITDYTYTARGWLASKTVRGDGTSANPSRSTRIEYWPTGLVSFVYQPDNSFTAFTYDAAHRLTDVYDNAGNKVHYTLDNAGNRTKEDTSDPNGTLTRTLSRVYNQLGQLQQSLTANNHATTYVYDANGNTTGVSDALGHATGNAYDPLGRLIQALQDTTGINASTQLTYDANDHLTQVLDPKGLATTYGYNGLGDLTQLTSPDTGATGYTYDAAGNRLTQTDARGVTSNYAYDALNRLVAASYSDSNYNQSYTYDAVQGVCQAGEQTAKGLLTGTQAKGATTQYCYDRWGQLVRKVQTVGSLTQVTRYAYDTYGRMQGLTYPDGGVVDYVRNTLGQITEVGYTPAIGSRSVIVTSVTYAPFGPSTGWNYGNGRTLSRTLTLDYRPNAIQDSQSGGLSYAYGFDAAGNLGALMDGTQTTSLGKFVYDGMNRLTQQQNGAGSPLYTWSYDATGNRTQAQSINSGTQAYTYDTGSHHLIQLAAATRTYDAVGNTTDMGNGKGYSYGPDSRMSAVLIAGVATMQYAYDARGQQVSRTSGSATSVFAYDEAGHWLGEYDSAGAAKQQVIWLDDMPVGVITTTSGIPTLAYIEPDHLGTPRAVIDLTRNVAIWGWPLTSEAFGNVQPDQDPDGDGVLFGFDMRFPGQRYDANTGLNQNWNRDYETASGRYSQSDPIGLAGGISTYGYVGSGPLGAIDPQGLFMTSVDAYCMQDPSGCADMFRDMTHGAAQVQRNLGNECAAQGLDAASDVFEAAAPILPLLTVGGMASKGLGGQNPLYKSAVDQFKNTKLSNAGRALTKHPEVIGETKETLRQMLRTDSAINDAAHAALRDIMRNGATTTPVLGRYGVVTQTRIPGGFGARWASDGSFIGFINP